MSESTPLLAGSHGHSRSGLLRRGAMIGTVSLLAAAGMAVVTSSGKSSESGTSHSHDLNTLPSSSASAVASTLETKLQQVKADSDATLTLKVFNEDYAKAPESLGTGYYKWSYNLEPGRVNHMEVSAESSDDTDTFTWYVLDNDSSNTVKRAVHEKTGQSVTYTPKLQDAGRVFAVAVVHKDSSGTVLATQRFQVACKYVRREFRELCDSDLTAYFDALSIIYHTGTEEGKEKYGDKFRGSDYFIKKHLGAMTLEACTPWHDSEVFVTAHAAFNLEFEGSLRSIDEKISAHYWEITVDTTRYAENWATESPIFSADMFGSYDWDTSAEHAYIADGRFTDVTFPTCDSDSDSSCPEHSIFGYMVDSNSYQEGPRLERSGSACGIPTTSKLPGCQFAERALSSKNLRKFWANVELRYHGDQHGLVGGVRNCKYEIADELGEFKHNATVMKYAGDIVLFMSIWGRTLFSDDDQYLGEYAGTAYCPHSSDDCDDTVDCTCTLPTVTKAIKNGKFDLDYAINVLSETSLYSDIAGARGWAAQWATTDDSDDISVDNWYNAFKDLDKKQTEALIMFCAKQASYQARSIMAYALSLGSVNDPIFWGAHNSWERMWHFKRLESELATEHEQTWWNAWNESDILDDSSAATCTWSSAAESTLPFWNLMEDEETENKYYTNKDMLRMFHPDNKNLPHIYDSLEYNHCTGEEADDADVFHTDFRSDLMSTVRKKMAKKYAAKVNRGYTEHEAKLLNSYYEDLFYERTLDNYGDRPVYEGTYMPEKKG